METLTHALKGYADPRLGEVVDRLEGYLAADGDLSFQIAAYKDGRLILDAQGGSHLGAESLMTPFSVSKNSIGMTVALLVQCGELDLDALVTDYWPEFGVRGKDRVTVRQLLSHQAGLAETTPALSWDQLLDHHAAAEALAAAWPLWRPGSSFGYHGITIGNLASELIFRATGRTLHEVYEQDVRSVLGVDFYLGLPPELDHRRVETLPMVPPADAPALEMPFNPMGALVFGAVRPGAEVDAANDERSWRFGHPGVSASVSARGIASLFAGCVTGIDGAAPLLTEDTVARVGEQQVRGTDVVLGQADRAHGIVFQKQSAQLGWGGVRSFGHDGAAGAVGCVDPETGVAFGFTIARGAWPGGGDARAIRIARDLGTMDL
ncbi:serine hydrolase domain-containing protein [Demequina phytophila]|uniref:serine hydrolase domain-containing protein n=1 Tax=Demequina phytophila TaxID=1638981 RepID=UPI000780A432|nr:serine hydrolase domain-containing protein [Demequina phytophila]